LLAEGRVPSFELARRKVPVRKEVRAALFHDEHGSPSLQASKDASVCSRLRASFFKVFLTAMAP